MIIKNLRISKMLVKTEVIEVDSITYDFWMNENLTSIVINPDKLGSRFEISRKYIRIYVPVHKQLVCYIFK